MSKEKSMPAIVDQGIFSNIKLFEDAQRIAKAISSSDMIPKSYVNNIGNTLIAMEMANRIGANIVSVMQSLIVIHGKPGWSSQFIIAAINSSGKFSPMRFEDNGSECYAWAYDKSNKEKLVGPKVTMQMAKAEGWIDKNGSKWKTMPEIMRRYRAAAFFGRLYAPEILMGMQTAEEIKDVGPQKTATDELKELNQSVSSEIAESIPFSERSDLISEAEELNEKV